MHTEKSRVHVLFETKCHQFFPQTNQVGFFVPELKQSITDLVHQGGAGCALS